MGWSIGQVARILTTTEDDVKCWVRHFAEHFIEASQLAEGREPEFEDADVMALAFVQYHWEDEPDFENIQFGLNSKDHLEFPFCKVLGYHKPFFEDPPEWLSEDCTFGSLLGGMLTSDKDFTMDWLADSYKRAADALVEQVVDKRLYDGYELIFPILYLYRHSLELYLKIKVCPEKLNHRLEPLVKEFDKMVQQQNRRIPSEVMDRLKELSTMDPDSFAFRYATSKKDEPNIKTDEVWVNLAYIRDFMDVFIAAMKKTPSRS